MHLSKGLEVQRADALGVVDPKEVLLIARVEGDVEGAEQLGQL